MGIASLDARVTTRLPWISEGRRRNAKIVANTANAAGILETLEINGVTVTNIGIAIELRIPAKAKDIVGLRPESLRCTTKILTDILEPVKNDESVFFNPSDLSSRVQFLL